MKFSFNVIALFLGVTLTSGVAASDFDQKTRGTLEQLIDNGQMAIKARKLTPSTSSPDDRAVCSGQTLNSLTNEFNGAREKGNGDQTLFAGVRLVDVSAYCLLVAGNNQRMFANLTTTMALLANDGYERKRAQTAYELAEKAGNYAEVKAILEKAQIYDTRKNVDAFVEGDASFNGTVTQWRKAFQDNKLGFKLKYDGKIVILSGYFFGAFDKTANTYASLSISQDPPKNGGVRSIVCKIEDSGTLEQAAVLNMGTPITVRGMYVHGERMLEPRLTKCTILKPVRPKK